MSHLLYKNEVFAIMGAAMTVHSELGAGFLEAVYQEALAIELSQRGIPFEMQKELAILYKGRTLNKMYRADCVCYDKIILELKATDKLCPADEAQLLNYLTATRMRLGVLINFGSVGKLQWKRLIK